MLLKAATVVQWHCRDFVLAAGVQGSDLSVNRHIPHPNKGDEHANPLWGAPAMPGGPLKLAIKMTQASVAKLQATKTYYTIADLAKLPAQPGPKTSPPLNASST